MAFCYILLSPLNPAKFCQDHYPFFPFFYLLFLRNVLTLLYSLLIHKLRFKGIYISRYKRYMTGIGSKEKLLCTIDGRASYYVYATNNGNSTIWFPSELLQCQQIFVSYITCVKHVIYATRIYIIKTCRQNEKNLTTYRTARILRLLHCVKAYQHQP